MSVKLECEYCHRTYYRSPAKAKESRFCSRSCHGKTRARELGLGISTRPNQLWNKGKTANEDERIWVTAQKAGDTYRRKINNGEIVPYWQGKRLTQEHKKKISKNHRNCSGENNPMFGRRGKNAPNYGSRLRGKQGFRPDLGHNVRSRWEANFARVLKYLGREYRWEPKTFELDNEETYTPDFWDNKRQCWWEVKAVWTEVSKRKVKIFKNNYPREKLKFLEKPSYKKLHEFFQSKVEWEYDAKGRI